MNFLTRWWNRRKLKVGLSKPVKRICDLCLYSAAFYCSEHAMFLCHYCKFDHYRHAVHVKPDPFMDLHSAAELMTGKVR